MITAGIVRGALHEWATVVRTIHRWMARRPTGRRAASVAALTGGLLLFAAAGVAWAADADKAASDPFLSAFSVTDTHGVRLDQLSLSLGSDSGLLSGGRLADSVAQVFLTIGWALYRLFVGLGLWLFDFAVQFKLLDVLRAPALVISTALESTISQLGLAKLFLGVAAVAMVIWVLKGRPQQGAVDILISLTAAAALSSALASPIDKIAGEHGLMKESRNIGMSTALAITAPDQKATTATDEQLRKRTTAELATKFIRVPHQLINYGAVIDEDATCVKVYDKTLKAGPQKDGDAAKKAMGECNESYEAAADNPMMGLVGMIILGFGGSILVLLLSLLATMLTTFTIVALWEAAKFSVELLRAILPGTSRAGVLIALMQMMIMAGAVAVALIGVAVVTVFIDAIYAGRAAMGLSFVQMFFFLDVVLLVAVVALVIYWWKAHKAGRKAGERLREGVSPDPLRAPSRSTPAPIGMARRAVSNAVGSAVARRATPEAAEGGPQGVAPTTQGKGSAQASASLKRGAAKKVLSGAATATKIGLASTVGAPVYVPRAAAAAKTAVAAKRAAVTTRLALARTQTSEKVAKKRDDAKAFGTEYVTNLGKAARFAGKVTGAANLGHAAVAAGFNPVVGAVIAGGALGLQTPTKGANKPATHQEARARAPRTVTPAPAQAQTRVARPSDVPKVTVSRAEAERQLLEQDRERLLQRMRERGAQVPRPGAARSIRPSAAAAGRSMPQPVRRAS